MIKKYVLTIFYFFVLIFSQAQKNNTTKLTFLNVYNLPNNITFNNVKMGGLSGIDYNPTTNEYYIISDDRSQINPARFYTAHIEIKNDRINTVQFKSNHFLKNPAQTFFPNNTQDKYHVPDPESIRFNKLKNTLIWSSEGERIVTNKDTILTNPFIYEMDFKGNFLDSFILPKNLQMQATKAGPRQNGVLEGLSFSTDYTSLFTNVEEPLYEDGEKATLENNNAIIRIFNFDVKTKKNIAQYFYPLDAIAHPSIPENAFKVNGVSEILCIDKNKLWVIERSFSIGVKSCSIKIFEVILSNKNNILQNNQAPILQKKLIYNFDTLNSYIDNIEGICVGPTLSNGNKSVILISDDNFNDQQITQFYLFEIKP